MTRVQGSNKVIVDPNLFEEGWTSARLKDFRSQIKALIILGALICAEMCF